MVVEGWCLGFAPLSTPPADVEEVNAALTAYAAVRDRLDALVVLDAPHHMAYAWREAAEAETRARGRPAMTPAEVRAFVDHYVPVYEAFGDTVWEQTAVPLLVLSRWR